VGVVAMPLDLESKDLRRSICITAGDGEQGGEDEGIFQSKHA
jgi:hypothetical protein